MSIKNRTVGIIDEPIRTSKSDALKIGLYANSLTRFIVETDTPMTVGVQGEWGSGKTSLLNTIWDKLSQDEKIKQIWVNSWENSLLCTPEESLLKITNEILTVLIGADLNKSRQQKIKNVAAGIFKGAVKVGATATLGVKAGQVADDFLAEKQNGIKELRSQLNELVKEIRTRETNPFEKIIIYIDDLDRIEPKDAVSILELLKNIFSVQGCVFILAIDYQVVVKGLEGKFGKQTVENEWEFRAFFDKIIQLPFMMPMNQYDIGNYVTSLLVDVGFLDGDNVKPEDIKEVVMLTLGGNPRSLKRLINAVTLIQIFGEEKRQTEDSSDDIKNTGEDEKILLFALLCCQIAYPVIYNLFIEKPDFTGWDEEFARKNISIGLEIDNEAFEREFAAAVKTEQFDEEWEQALYRICFHRTRLKHRVKDLSRLLNFIKDTYEDKEEGLESLIASVLSETSVTSVESTDIGQVALLPKKEAGSYKRRVLDGIDTFLLDLEVTRNCTQEAIDLNRYIAEEMKKRLPEATPYFATHMSFNANKKKFMRFQATFADNKKFEVTLQLLKHHKHDYRIPKVDGVLAKMDRRYTQGKIFSCHNSAYYRIRFKDAIIFKNAESKVWELITEAFEMAQDKDRILAFDYPAGSVKSELKTIEKNSLAVEEFADEVLMPGYYYEV
jgi:hypothetical protein